MEVIIYYAILVLFTFYLVWHATSLKGKNVEKATVYELIDRASWILGAILLAITPIWWKFPIKNLFGAILIPTLGIIITGGIAMLILGHILSAKTTKELIVKIISLGVFFSILFFIVRFFIRLF